MSYVPSEMCNNNLLSRQLQNEVREKESQFIVVFLEGGEYQQKSSQVSDNCCHLTGTLSAAIKTNKQAARNDGKTAKSHSHSYAALPEYFYSTPKVCYPLWRGLSMRNIAHTQCFVSKHIIIWITLQKQRKKKRLCQIQFNKYVCIYRQNLREHA